MKAVLRWLGRRLARFLSKRTHVHGTGPATRPELLIASLRIGDILLVEGNSRVSTVIKYLTQSTWSHAALYIGTLGNPAGDSRNYFIEADIVDGVRRVDVAEFEGLHTRICRPVGLTAEECRKVADFAIARLGNQYDLRNVFDLARYVLPTPPVPTLLRRRMLMLGSGDPTRAICSTLIAQAFQAIRYPILPSIDTRRTEAPDCPGCMQEILGVRHHSLFAPRDFDVSPYFQIVKPTIETGFDFHTLRWEETQAAEAATNRGS